MTRNPILTSHRGYPPPRVKDLVESLKRAGKTILLSHLLADLSRLRYGLYLARARHRST